MAFQEPYLDMLPEFALFEDTHSLDSEAEVPGKPYLCPQQTCGRRFTRKKALQEHVQGPAHSNEKPFKCKQCTNKQFTRANDLKRHELEVHGKKRFVCEVVLPTGERWGCLKRFSRFNTLKQHQKDCVSCKPPDLFEPNRDGPTKTSTLKLLPGTQVSWPSALEATARHMVRSQIHHLVPVSDWDHDEKEFVCKICGLKRRKLLIGSFLHHLIGHLEDIEYQAFGCGHCNARFVLQEHLRQHKHVCFLNTCSLINHNTNGIWGCGKSFNTVHDLLRHTLGLDGTNCRSRSDRMNEKLKESILEQMMYMGIGITPDRCSEFSAYAHQARKEALELNWNEDEEDDCEI